MSVSRGDLEGELYGLLSPEDVNHVAGVLWRKYDILEKPEPIGTVRASIDPENRDSAVYVKVAEGNKGWAAIFFGTDHGLPVAYAAGRTPLARSVKLN
ncbi:hypothetical protein PBI_NEBKISS_92 [Mycobacterium phage Nebkiss]|nr:hypothetical protein PBI_NEBKISS_92 [Mycobacterium phage Nebkiss]